MNARSGLKEPYWRRIIAFIVISILCSIFSGSSIYDAYSILITSITILTGFAFTALFSDQTMADIGLPEPRNETDVADINVLKRLGCNFKARSFYFIALSIIGVVIMTFAAIDWSIPKWISVWYGSDNLVSGQSEAGTEKNTIKLIGEIFSLILTAVISFIYLECLYTFYRLSDTIIAIVSIRRNYIRHSER